MEKSFFHQAVSEPPTKQGYNSKSCLWKNLPIGGYFDFDGLENEKNALPHTASCTFFDRCRKVSARKYQSVDSGLMYQIGSVYCMVYNINSEK